MYKARRNNRNMKWKWLKLKIQELFTIKIRIFKQFTFALYMANWNDDPGHEVLKEFPDCDQEAKGEHMNNQTLNLTLTLCYGGWFGVA